MKFKEWCSEFPSRRTCATYLGISVRTLQVYLSDGLIPKPILRIAALDREIQKQAAKLRVYKTTMSYNEIIKRIDELMGPSGNKNDELDALIDLAIRYEEGAEPWSTQTPKENQP